MASFVSWFVIVYGMSKKLFLGAVCMKTKIQIVKGLFGQVYGQLKGMFDQFLCPVKGLFYGHFICHTLPLELSVLLLDFVITCLVVVV